MMVKKNFNSYAKRRKGKSPFILIFLGFLGFISLSGFLIAVISYHSINQVIADLDANGFLVQAKLDPLTRYRHTTTSTGSRSSSSTWEYYACLRPPEDLPPRAQLAWDRASKNSDFPNRVAFLENMDGRIVEHITRSYADQLKDGQVVDFQFKENCWRIVRPNEMHLPLFWGSLGGVIIFWGMLIWLFIRRRLAPC